MIRILPAPVRGVLSVLLYFLNTAVCCVPLFILAAAKALVPWDPWRRGCTRGLTRIAEGWVGVNSLNQTITGDTRLEVQGVETLRRRGWYLVLANHQSWVDILVLQRIFHRKIPFLKFFIKKPLIWFPLLGQAWWALDFPFVERYTKKLLARKPHLKGRDMEVTRRACEKFRTLPVSIMNFVEGTRFTPEKHRRQRSPYANLLRTRAGGIAFVLGSMGDQIQHILDVTIVYAQGPKSFWAFLCGKIPEIRVHVRPLPVTPDLMGDYAGDIDFRRGFQAWLNDLWKEKDRRFETLRQAGASGLPIAAPEDLPAESVP